MVCDIRTYVRIRAALKMTERNAQPGRYESARDLPSIAELLEQIQGIKLLSRVVGRKHRKQILEIESQVKELVAVVDRFYDLLGNRHWIFHDRLHVDKIKALLDLPPEEAEKALINEIYRDAEWLRFMTMGLRKFPEMQVRMDLVEKAAQDYREDRFYASALVLLTVMDGFVNDLDPSHRRGLHTREADELAAWDTVVGHHMGLRNAHTTFTTGIYKTSSEPVYELHRNGIIHGMLVNYDNIIVATKAWNRLFAVADWATSIENEKKPKEPEPSWGDIFRKTARSAAAKKALDEWRPKNVAANNPDFYDEDVCVRAKTYLDSWKRQNYGAMAALISPQLGEGESFQLDDYTLVAADFEASAVCEIEVELVIEGEQRDARMRWIREGADGMAATPNEPGTWYLYLWGPWAMSNRSDAVKNEA
jgi:hypothetical protein